MLRVFLKVLQGFSSWPVYETLVEFSWKTFEKNLCKTLKGFGGKPFEGFLRDFHL